VACPSCAAPSISDEGIPIRDALPYLRQKVIGAMVAEIAKALSKDWRGLVEGAERAHVGPESTSLLTDRNQLFGVVDDRLDLWPAPYHVGILHNAIDLARSHCGHSLGIETVKCPFDTRPFGLHDPPGHARLKDNPCHCLEITGEVPRDMRFVMLLPVHASQPTRRARPRRLPKELVGNRPGASFSGGSPRKPAQSFA